MPAPTPPVDPNETDDRLLAHRDAWRWVRWGSGAAAAVLATAAALRSKALGPRLRRAGEQTRKAVASGLHSAETAMLSAAQTAEERAEALAAATPPARRARRRRRKRAAIAAGGVLLAVLLLLAGGAWLGSRALAGLQPRLVRAVRDATGRELTLDGPLRWQLLPPRARVRGVALANLPGGSGPWMLRAAAAELRPAWLPLLVGRVRPGVLRLERPVLLLERTAAGPNWDLPARGASSLPASWRVEARDGALRLGAAPPFLAGLEGAVLPVPALTLRQDGRTAPLRVTARLGEGGGVVLDGTGGSLPALRAAPDRAWPLALALRTAAGGAGTARGGLVPRTGGWDLALDVTLPALALPAPALPATAPFDAARTDAADATTGDAAVGGRVTGGDAGGATDQAVLRGGVPPGGGDAVTLGGVQVSARLRGTGSDRPDVSELHARVATAAAAGLLPGLVLRDATLDRGAADGPVRLAAAGAYGTVPLRLVLLARPVPAGGSPLGGIELTGLRLDSPAGDLSGALALRWAGRPGAEGELAGGRLDLDRLLGERRRLLGETARAAAPYGDVDPAPPAAGRLFPDVPLPLAALRRADATLSLRLGRVLLGNAEWRDVAAALSLRGGLLRLSPVTAQAPGGPLSVELALDAAASPAVAAAVVGAPSLALGPLLAALGLPPLASGRLLAEARLRSTGDTPRALAAALSGGLRLALTEGAVRGGALDALAGGGLSGFLPPLADGVGGLGGDGSAAGGLGAEGVPVRDLSLALRLRDGQGILEALSLDAGGLRVTGTGGLDLRDETLRVRLQPQRGPALVVSGRLATPLVTPAAATGDAGSGAARGATARGDAAAIRGAAPGGGFVPLTARDSPSVGVLDRLMRESLGDAD